MRKELPQDQSKISSSVQDFTNATMDLHPDSSISNQSLAQDVDLDSLNAQLQIDPSFDAKLFRARKDGSAVNIHDLQDREYFKPWVKSYPPEVPEFVDTHLFENINELYDNTIKHFSSHTAYVNLGSSLTFKQLDLLVKNFAAFLQVSLGLKKGDKIAIMMPNLMQYPIVFFGALRAGLVVINVNPLYTPREIQAQLENCEATTIVVISNYAFNVSKVVEQTYIKNFIVTNVGDAFSPLKSFIVNQVVQFKGMVPKFTLPEQINQFDFKQALKTGSSVLSDFQPVEIAYNDLALLQYTGGTTGRSKGAMLSHGNLVANVAQAYGIYGYALRGEKETILTVIPLYHIFALTVNLLFVFFLGAKNIFITDPHNIKSFVKEVKDHPEISILTGVNTLFNLFVSHEAFADVTWENLHLVIGGGASVQSGVEQRFFEKTGLHILEGYGLTECSPLCAVCPANTTKYTGSIGLIVPSTIARIVDADGNEITDLEHEGELEIKGPQVMLGYYKAPKNNSIIYDDGFVRTGDIAKWMEGGYIKLIDRLKDMILVSGFNVFPNEIEDVISRFHRVLECAVIGIPSEKTGEAVKLFVVRKDPTLTADEVRNYCRAYLTPYKVPRIIEFVNSLPKSALGKVLRRKLRDLDGAHPMSAEQQLALQQQRLEQQAKEAASVTELDKSKPEVNVQEANHVDLTTSPVKLISSGLSSMDTLLGDTKEAQHDNQGFVTNLLEKNVRTVKSLDEGSVHEHRKIIEQALDVAKMEYLNSEQTNEAYSYEGDTNSLAERDLYLAKELSGANSMQNAENLANQAYVAKTNTQDSYAEDQDLLHTYNLEQRKDFGNINPAVVKQYHLFAQQMIQDYEAYQQRMKQEALNEQNRVPDLKIFDYTPTRLERYYAENHISDLQKHLQHAQEQESMLQGVAPLKVEHLEKNIQQEILQSADQLAEQLKSSAKKHDCALEQREQIRAAMLQAKEQESEEPPVKKSIGAITLEHLLSSKYAMDAGINTPNIHKVNSKS